jgi:hypothetical protein
MPSYKNASINYFWPHYYAASGTYSYASSCRNVTIDVLGKSPLNNECDLVMSLGGDRFNYKWLGPILNIYKIYDNNQYGFWGPSGYNVLDYECETLEDHYYNNHDGIDFGDGWSCSRHGQSTYRGRGGFMVESPGGWSGFPWKARAEQQILIEKAGDSIAIPSFSKIKYTDYDDNTKYASIGHMLMQPLAYNPGGAYGNDKRMPLATSSNTFRPSALIEDNPYAQEKFFTMDLMFGESMPSGFDTQYQTINSLIEDLNNLSQGEDWYNVEKLCYSIGIGARYSSSPYSSSQYVKTNVATSSVNPVQNGLWNKNEKCPELNYIPGGRVSTFFNSSKIQYLYGIIRSAKQISNVSKLTPVVSIFGGDTYNDDRWYDVPRNKMSYIKYLGYTADSTALNNIGDWLPSGRTSSLCFFYSFYISIGPSDDDLKNMLRSSLNGTGVIIRGCKYQ